MANASARVRAQIGRALGRFGPHEQFATDVLEITRTGPIGNATLAGEGITVREFEVLRDLPSMLSLDEIAEAHVVSINTVKTHLKALYRKLAVNSRREAVDRARELGLI